jgi:hypothetical protein
VSFSPILLIFLREARLARARVAEVGRPTPVWSCDRRAQGVTMKCWMAYDMGWLEKLSIISA